MDSSVLGKRTRQSNDKANFNNEPTNQHDRRRPRKRNDGFLESSLSNMIQTTSKENIVTVSRDIDNHFLGNDVAISSPGEEPKVTAYANRIRSPGEEHKLPLNYERIGVYNNTTCTPGNEPNEPINYEGIDAYDDAHNSAGDELQGTPNYEGINAYANSLDTEPQDQENREEDKRFKLLTCSKALKLVVRWDRLFGLFCIHGKIRFSAQQYEIIRKAICTASNGSNNLFTRKTITNVQWDYLKNHCFAKSTDVYIFNNSMRTHRSKTQSQTLTKSHGHKDSRDCVRIVLPSEWAKLDVQTMFIYKDLYEQEDILATSSTIEGAPIVSPYKKAHFIGSRISLWTKYKQFVVPSLVNEPIKIICGTESKEFDYDSQGWTKLESTADVQINGSRNSFKARVGPAWCVRNKHKCQAEEIAFPRGMTDQEKKVFNACQFATHNISEVFDLSKRPRNKRSSNNVGLQTERTSRRGRGKIRGSIRRVRDNGIQCNSQNETDVHDKFFTFPGDICFFLRTHTEEHSHFVCILIASFVWREGGKIGERIVWLDSRKFSSCEKSKPLIAPILCWVPIVDMPSFCDAHVPYFIKNDEEKTYNKGVLDDGTPYVIYRFLLYSDGFKQKKSLFDVRSVCGCYIMLVGLSHGLRTSSTTARILTLAAHGQDENEVLSHIVEDIVNGITEGIDAIDPYGNKVKIFLDVVAIIGDYPALSAGTDVSGHMADAFCTFCVIRKRKGSSNPEILYTVKLHSRRPSLVRNDVRMKILRKETIEKKMKKHLGLSHTTEEETSSLIAVNLAYAIERVKDKFPRKDGRLLFDPTFDSHLSAAAAPDHLFKGLIQDVLSVCFSALPSESHRKFVDNIICNGISANNLPSIDSLLKWDKKGKYTGLHSLTTSTLFCALLFAGPVFRNIEEMMMDSTTAYAINQTMNSQDSNETDESSSDSSQTKSVSNVRPFLLPSLLQKVVGLAYWWPNLRTGNSTEQNYVRGFDGCLPINYYGTLSAYADEYLQECKKYYTSGGINAKMLDKPNAHRLKELCVHTIPCFGHALNVSEMVLEMVHRTFKEWLEKNSHHNAHLTAMDHALSRDWATRAYATYQAFQHGDEKEKEIAEKLLRRLLLGAYVNELDPNDSDVSALFNQLKEQIPSAFRDPIPKQLQGDTHKSLLPKLAEYWSTQGLLKQSDCSYYANAINLIENMLNIVHPDRAHSFNCFAYAKLITEEKYTRKRLTSHYNTIGQGDVVTAFVDDPDSNFVTCSPDGVQAFYEIEFIIGELHGSKWLSLRKMICISTSTDSKVYSVSPHSSTQVAELDISFRKVLKIHKCSTSCKLRTQEGKIFVDHDKNNDRYFLIGRKDGFPPHLG